MERAEIHGAMVTLGCVSLSSEFRLLHARNLVAIFFCFSKRVDVLNLR